MTPGRTLVVMLGTAALSSLAVACGGDDEDENPPVPPTAKCFVEHGATLARSPDEVSFFLTDAERGRTDTSAGGFNSGVAFTQHERSQAASGSTTRGYIVFVARPAGERPDVRRVLADGPRLKSYVAYAENPTPAARDALARCLDQLIGLDEG